ncbi:hypothetical protein K227x_18620 [Rubripirellula lacrimiformis]|uniref:Uncharacterized protein n=1 Tax=Rubripirellula lacrimiformis TaxID=1930273 RepID=A0A517N902_9BACT|nr:hypothetical protein K227x_18620 [Rubripirellula lacrimiformis]
MPDPRGALPTRRSDRAAFITEPRAVHRSPSFNRVPTGPRVPCQIRAARRPRGEAIRPLAYRNLAPSIVPLRLTACPSGRAFWVRCARRDAHAAKRHGRWHDENLAPSIVHLRFTACPSGRAFWVWCARGDAHAVKRLGRGNDGNLAQFIVPVRLTACPSGRAFSVWCARGDAHAVKRLGGGNDGNSCSSSFPFV